MKPTEFVKEYSIRSLVCCFSGGKDSLVATHYVLNELDGFKSHDIDKHVIYVDTGAMVPGNTDFVKELCEDFGWNLTVLYGKFFERAKEWGMPTMYRRWCCYEVKLKPIKKFVRDLNPQRAEVLGLRQDESARRKKKGYRYVSRDRRNRSWRYLPILDWTEKDVLRYIRKFDLPMAPYYKLGIKESCLCGAFSSKKEMQIVRAQFPEFFQKFVELEAQFEGGGSCFFFGNKRYYAKDFLKQKTLSEGGTVN